MVAKLDATPAESANVSHATPTDPSDTPTEESTEMAAKTTETAAQKNTRIREEIAGAFERLRSLAEADNADGVKELSAETDGLIAQLPAKERNALRQEMKAAGQAAPKEAPAASTELATAAVGAEIVVPTREVDALVAKGSEMVRDLAASKFKGGREIANIIFDIRTRITKDGVPDLNADLDASKKKSAEVYDSVTENLPEEGTDANADGVRAEIASIRKSAQNAMNDVRVEYIRALDHSPEEAAKFAKLTEAKADAKPSEVVAAYFDVTLLTRAEIAKAAREAKKALEAAQTKLTEASAAVSLTEAETAAKVEAGEMTADEATEALTAVREAEAEATKAVEAAEKAAPGGEKPAKTPAEELADAVAKMAKLLDGAKVAGVDGLDDKGKKATRAKLEKIRDAVKELLGEL
jgi:hypothetical protein